MTRKVKNRKLVKTSRREPKLMRDLRAGVRGLKRHAWDALAGAGLVAVLYLIVQALGGGR